MKDLEKALREFTAIFERAKGEGRISGYALIGAVAVSARGRPRATEDIDFLISAEKRFLTEIIPEAAKSLGYSVEVSHGSPDDPMRGLVRVYDKEHNEVADIMPTSWKWQEDILRGAEYVEVSEGLSVPVARADDLIVLKLKAGGPQDLLDAEDLLMVAHQRGDVERPRLLRLAKRARVGKALTHLLKRLKLSL